MILYALIINLYLRHRLSLCSYVFNTCTTPIRSIVVKPAPIDLATVVKVIKKIQISMTFKIYSLLRHP